MSRSTHNWTVLGYASRAYQLSFTRKGRGQTQFAKKAHITMVRKQMKNYNRLRRLVDRWIELSTQVCQGEGRERNGVVIRPRRQPQTWHCPAHNIVKHTSLHGEEHKKL